jgi:hypothetical protein
LPKACDEPCDHCGLADTSLPAQQHQPPATARNCALRLIQFGQHRAALE